MIIIGLALLFCAVIFGGLLLCGFVAFCLVLVVALFVCFACLFVISIVS